MHTIIHLISRLDPYGGTARKYYGWLKLSRYNHVFFLYEDSVQADEIVNAFWSSGGQIFKTKHRDLIHQVQEILMLTKQAERPVLMGHYFRGAILASIVGAIGKVPTVIPLHAPANLFSFPKRFVYGLMLRTAERVVYNSHFTARSFAYSGTNQVVYNGCSFDSIPVKSTFFPKDAISLLAVGGLVKFKQYNVLLEMLRFLPERYSLTIIGDGPERKHLEHLAASNDLSGRVCFKGYVLNAYTEFSNHDIFVHPSIGESFGIVIAEALFARVPVVVNDKCAPYEVVNGGEYGWIAESNDPRHWAQLVMSIVDNPQEAWMKASKGRTWAMEMFSDLTFSSSMDKIIEELSGHL